MKTLEKPKFKDNCIKVKSLKEESGFRNFLEHLVCVEVPRETTILIIIVTWAIWYSYQNPNNKLRGSETTNCLGHMACQRTHKKA